MTATDLQARVRLQNAKRAQAVTGGMRYHIAFNGDGASSGDALTVRSQQLGAGFSWISHTCDHADLDPARPTASRSPSSTTTSTSPTSSGCRPFSVAEPGAPRLHAVSPTPNVMRATFDAGIRYLVGDTSVSGYDNPSPNAGIYNPLQPQILMIPRRPTNLFYNVSTPDQWMAEYNDLYRSFWGRDLSYDEILDNESDVLAQYLLKGENDPWMFHQPDLRVYGSGRSLLGDLLDGRSRSTRRW